MLTFFDKGHSLYQISSKMLPGSKVITFILWHLKKIQVHHEGFHGVMVSTLDF